MKRALHAATCVVALSIAGPALALNICVEGAYPPFSETAADGSLVGFDIDIAIALCTELGEECDLVKVDWDGIIPALLEKKCDAIVASMSITPERMEVIDFTKKYYRTSPMMVAAADSGLVATPEGMAGKVIGVQRGTTHNAYLDTYYGDSEIRLYASQDEAVLDLSAGRLDAVMADSVALSLGFLKTDAGEGYAALDGNFHEPAIHGNGNGIGVRKEDTELRDRLSAAIDAIRADGAYGAIEARYFDFDIYGGES
jgi:polar amino acid transport system substrate-binding protein/arginine/ornithine transport system substrate-binding protein